jgi:hypothetical protein
MTVVVPAEFRTTPMVSLSEGGRLHTRVGTVNIKIATNRMGFMSSLRFEVKVPIHVFPDYPIPSFLDERTMPGWRDVDTL